MAFCCSDGEVIGRHRGPFIAGTSGEDDSSNADHQGQASGLPFHHRCRTFKAALGILVLGILFPP